MFKIMFAFLAIVTMFSGQVCSLPEKLSEEVMFSAYNNGYKIEMTKEDTQKFDDMFTAALKGCRVMPALGVSLHDETMKELEKGVWIRFEFDETLEVNGLPFDELLIKLTKDMYGFNIIRGNDGVYDGRCFYIDIPRNMDNVYDFVSSLSVSDEKFELRETLETSLVQEELKIKEVSCEECEKCEEECDKCENCTSAESMPSVNKESKEKPSTVIEQKDLKVEEVLLESLEF